MAKPKRDFGAMFTGLVGAVATFGVAALAVDWMKANGFWVKPKGIAANGDFGCETGCMAGEEDPVVKGARDL